MNESNLIVFYGQECPHCQRMEVIEQRLQKEEGINITRFETWHNDENAAKMEEYDRGFCGGVPFYFNIKTQKWICGEASYEDLKKWAII